MGFKLSLGKENNFLGTDFKDAYWKIYNVGIGEQNGTLGVQYVIRAYPSREASKMDGQTVKQLAFGGSIHHDYDSALYEFWDFVPKEYVFPHGIPNDLNGIKTDVYNYFIGRFNLTSAVAVYEEGQNE